MKTEFLANISHELRTPLNVMLSGLQLIDLHKANGDVIFKTPETYEKVGYIKQNGYRLLRLINNLIDITKIDSGFFQLHRENINIVQVVEDITLSIAEYIKLKGITLIFDTNEQVGMFAIAAILIGGASVSKATNKQALLGVILFHTLFIVSPTAGKNLFNNAQIGEYFRVFVAYGVICVSLALYAWKKIVESKKDLKM